MALTDKKVTDALLQTGVVSAPDKLTGTAAENKAVFDRLIRNVVAQSVNPVIDELSGEGGAAAVGAKGGTVQEQLDAAAKHRADMENAHGGQEKADAALAAAKAYADGALAAAKKYAEEVTDQKIVDSGAVLADGEGNAENANALAGIPGENYLPEKITQLSGAKTYEYAASRPCFLRPSFVGKTVQEGTPSPDSPALIKGVLDPWIKTTAEDGTIVTRQLMAELFQGDSFDGTNLSVNGIVTRRNLDLQLSPGNWTIEAGDENGLLESADITVLPDPATYGRKVYLYQHVKAGAVHQLIGTPGAEQITFTATDVYQDGDTWTLNGAPVAVTYNDGQALLPTAVIAGDMVEAVIQGDTVRLMLQKPTPQRNILINADFKNPVNQRQAKNAAAFQYGIDMWVCNETSHTIEDGYLDIPETGVLTYRFDEAEAQKFEGRLVTVCIAMEDGLHIGSNIYDPNNSTNFINDPVVSGYNYGTGRQLQFLAKKAFKAYFVKMELGGRFTGMPYVSRAETLAECQWRQLAVNGSNYIGGGAYSARGSTYTIPTPVTMRAKPVLTKWAVKYGAMDSNGNVGGVLTASVTDFGENSIKVDVTVDKDLTMGPSVLREATFFFDANV